MASGDLLAYFDASGGMMRPSSNAATPDIVGADYVLDFDASTNETMRFRAYMPPYYGGGGLTVTARFGMSSATTGNIEARTRLDRRNAAAAYSSDSFGTQKGSGAVAVPGTAGTIGIATITHTSAEMDGVVANDMFVIEIERNTAVASNAAGDMELSSIAVRET